MPKSMKQWGVLFFLAKLFTTQAWALEPDVLFSQVSPSVWSVRTFDAQERPLRSGSAVVTAPGRLITNCHVLAKASSFVIRRDNVTYGATLEYPDVERDLCQIRVANFNATPVRMGPAGGARVGQRVYAIGSPRGLENTLGEGLLSGLRGGDGSDPRLLQTTAPMSAGSSGGGLFDSEGRLIGIMSSASGDAGSLNVAVPAEFVAEIPARAQAALARWARGEDSGGTSAAPARRTALGPADPLRAGDTLEYVRIDRFTGNRSPVLYRLDRITGDEMVFNMGGRIEKTGGQVVSAVSPLGGMFDSSMPPGGWAPKGVKTGMRWHVDFVASSGDKWRHELDAAVVGERSVRVDGVELKAMQIAYSGWVYISWGSGSSPVGTRFEAEVWYSPEMGRVVRFEADHRRTNSNRASESMELVHVLR